MAHENSDDIFIRDAATGDQRLGKRRRGAQYMKNSQRSNDYVQFAIRLFTIIKVGLGALTTFAGVVWALFEFVAVPRFERAIQNLDAPIIERLNSDEAAFTLHLIEVEKRSASHVTRDELRGDLKEIKELIREARK